MKKLSLLALSTITLAVLVTILVSKHLRSQNELPVGNGAAARGKMSAQELVFLLQYIGKDYGGAVEAGKVIDAYEYDEMMEFCDRVVSAYQCQDKKATETSQQLGELQNAVYEKKEWSDIKQLTRQLASRFCDEMGVRPYPVVTPNLDNGRVLYADNCAACHGISGDGHGPSSDDMKPAPTDFTDPALMNDVTPFQFYNAITFGIEETAMPSYAIGFTEQQCWDVAFYLMTLRKDFAPTPIESTVNISLRHLATQSNRELFEDLSHRGQSKRACYGSIDYLRTHLSE